MVKSMRQLNDGLTQTYEKVIHLKCIYIRTNENYYGKNQA